MDYVADGVRSDNVDACGLQGELVTCQRT